MAEWIETLVLVEASNKFNIHWQVVRTKARNIKDVRKKIDYVLHFLKTNPNKHNYDRVLNWVKMTGVAYTGHNREMFEREAAILKDNQDKYMGEVDMPNELKDVPQADVELVYKDLSKRKYGFQYKNVPKAHTEFVERLKQHLGVK